LTNRISSDAGWRRPLHYGMLGMVLMGGIDSSELVNIACDLISSDLG
jgi:hypothetical protein